MVSSYNTYFSKISYWVAITGAGSAPSFYTHWQFCDDALALSRAETSAETSSRVEYIAKGPPLCYLRRFAFRFHRPLHSCVRNRYGFLRSNPFGAFGCYSPLAESACHIVYLDSDPSFVPLGVDCEHAAPEKRV